MADVTSESAEAKSFWDAFSEVFGVSRRRIATFEEPVKKSDGRSGYVDLLWRGVLLVERKSAGKDPERAAKQALDYFPGLKERDLPRYFVVSDFRRLRLYTTSPTSMKRSRSRQYAARRARVWSSASAESTSSGASSSLRSNSTSRSLGRESGA